MRRASQFRWEASRRLALTIALAALGALGALACGGSTIEKRVAPAPPDAASEKVGSGYVLQRLDPGAKVATDARGERVVPKVTDDFNQPPVSSKWWSSLMWQHDPDNPYSRPMYAHPLVLRARAEGLGLSYPNQPTVHNREYMFSYAEDLTVGLKGMRSADARVASYSDFTVTAAWQSGEERLRATFGHGLPFVYFTRKGSSDVAVTLNGAAKVWQQTEAAVALTVNGHHYALFAPRGATWTATSNGFGSDLAGGDYWSIAVLPDAEAPTFELFRKHAHTHVTSGRVSFEYAERDAKVETRYELRTSVKERGAHVVEQPLIALYRHQWQSTNAALTPHAYQSPRGIMKLLDGAKFSTSLPFSGVLPHLPVTAGVDRERLASMLESELAKPDLFPPGLGPKREHDAYWVGKSLGKVAMLLQLADAIGADDAKTSLLNALENHLENFFDGRAPGQLYYDKTWRSLVALPASYGSSEQLNDHHFHYGYFVYAAATVARYDRRWVRRYGELVDLMIKDVANWDRRDERFPFLRYMDVYAGHSWANGPAQFDEGNNQEASSEDLNFSAAVVLWGMITRRPHLRDLGAFLFANQVAATEQYWFDVNDAVFPDKFAHPAVGMVWGAGAKYDTWFDQDPLLVQGINLLPFTGASLYLGRHPDVVARGFAHATRNDVSRLTTWRDYWLMFYALAEPGRAAKLFEDDPYFEPEFGNTLAATYAWIAALGDMGRVDPRVTANTAAYAVFRRGDRRTYVAYNTEARPRRVRFSDGSTLLVGPKQVRAAAREVPAETGAVVQSSD
jgi:endoglucanase Acf2